MKTIFLFYLLLIPSIILTGIFYLNPAAFPFNVKVYSAMPVAAFKYSQNVPVFAESNYRTPANTHLADAPKQPACSCKRTKGLPVNADLLVGCNKLIPGRSNQALQGLTQLSLSSHIVLNEMPLPFYY